MRQGPTKSAIGPVNAWNLISLINDYVLRFSTDELLLELRPFITKPVSISKFITYCTVRSTRHKFDDSNIDCNHVHNVYLFVYYFNNR